MTNTEPKTRVVGTDRGFPMAISGDQSMPWVVGYLDCDVIVRHYTTTENEAKRIAEIVTARMNADLKRFWDSGNWGIDKRPTAPKRAVGIVACRNEAA